MSFQTVFKRYELKYMLTCEQKKKVLVAMEPYMKLDKYGRTTIRNLYYDTDTYLLIRRSIEKPTYKEKLRIRSYSKADADSTVFVELKKKYKHVVYKRRISLPEVEAIKWLSGEQQPSNPNGMNFIFNLCSFLQIHRKVFAEEHLFYSYAQGATVHQCRKDAP